MGADFWTDARIDELLRLWVRGHSTTQIGAMMGCTRNAIAGKLHRLNAPAPIEKLPVPRDRIYMRQMSEVARAKARLREKRYRQRRAAVIGQSMQTRRAVRAMFLANGNTRTSAEYRKHLPQAPEMTKGELRAMLAQAVQNTAALT